MKMQKDPKIVIESVLDNNGTKTEKNINIYPVTITRYAFLEMLDSPFLNPEIPFGISTVTPTAFIFCSTAEDLRKYTSKDIDKLVADSYKWADDNLDLESYPELIKNITDQMMKLNKAAPSSSDSMSSSDGSKKK